MHIYIARLHLGVDHEWPASRVRDDDPVVDGEGIVGKAVDVPVAHL